MALKKRTHQINVRMNDKERSILNKLAEALGVTPSDVLRLSMKQVAQKLLRAAA